MQTSYTNIRDDNGRGNDYNDREIVSPCAPPGITGTPAKNTAE